MTIALATHVGLQKNGSRKVLDLVVQLICFIIYFLIFTPRALRSYRSEEEYMRKKY